MRKWMRSNEVAVYGLVVLGCVIAFVLTILVLLVGGMAA